MIGQRRLHELESLTEATRLVLLNGLLRARSATEDVAASALAYALEGFKRLRTAADVTEAAGRASEHLQLLIGCRQCHRC